MQPRDAAPVAGHTAWWLFGQFSSLAPPTFRFSWLFSHFFAVCVCVRASAAVDRVLVFGLPLDCATARKTDLPCSRLWPALLVPHHLLLPLSLSLAPTFIPGLPKKFPVATSAHGACGCWQCFCSLGKHSAWKIVQLHLLHFSHLPLFLPSLVSFAGAV